MYSLHILKRNKGTFKFRKVTERKRSDLGTIFFFFLLQENVHDTWSQ